MLVDDVTHSVTSGEKFQSLYSLVLAPLKADQQLKRMNVHVRERTLESVQSVS